MSDNEDVTLPQLALDPPATVRKSSANDNDIAKRRTVFVRGLPYSTTSEQLSEKFSFIAPLKHATIVQDPKTKQSRGFGFVTFSDAADAKRAVDELHNQDFEGRKLKVEIAQPRHREDEKAGKEVPTPAGAPKKDDGVKKRAPRLIVRNLAWGVKKPEQLIKVFQSYGKVKEVIIPKKKTGEMSGFAFVTMKGYKNAERAIEMVNGRDVEGRPVAVDWAVEKKDWEEVTKKEEPEPKEADSEDEDMEDEGDDEEEEAGSEEEEEEDEDEEDEDSEKDGEDDEDEKADIEEDEDDPDAATRPPTDSSTTLFIRNLPFHTTDDDLYEHFSQFGPVKYARIVMDHATDRPKGTGFVNFYNPETTSECLQNAPTPAPGTMLIDPDTTNPLYVISNRVLSITRAVDRSTAGVLASSSAATRDKAHSDKRRLYLLREGNLTPLQASQVSATEKALREQSVEQRKKLLQADPNLHLSLTRLSVRNIPRWITDKDLKMVARKAIPGFAEDVANRIRDPITKEELARDGGAGKAAEQERRDKGKGVVKQAKIQLEKVGGRSRGYGFIEYYTHKHSLMGLRYLNGLALPSERPEEGVEWTDRKVKVKGEKKRLIVEFAIENAKVVARRQTLEEKSRQVAKDIKEGRRETHAEKAANAKDAKKRKRGGDEDDGPLGKKKKGNGARKDAWKKDGNAKKEDGGKKPERREGWNQKKKPAGAANKQPEEPKKKQPKITDENTLAIIQKKRMMRRAKK